MKEGLCKIGCQFIIGSVRRQSAAESVSFILSLLPQCPARFGRVLSFFLGHRVPEKVLY
jgi:hypothetical protein